MSLSFRFFIILTFIMIGRPQDYFSFLIPFRIALVFTFIALVSTIGEYKKLFLERIFETREAKRYALFFLIMIFGIPFAYHGRLAFESTFLKYLSNMLYFYLFIVHVDTFKKLKSTLFILSLSVLSYAIFAFSAGSFWKGRYYAGSMFDPNDIAYLFNSLIPLSFIFIRKNERSLKRVLASVSILISLGVILFTGSRGGFVGLFAVFFLMLFSKSGGIRRSHKIALIASLVIVFLFYGHNIDMARYLSITDIETDYNVTEEFGRIAIWEKALQLTLENPLTGVGVNCFPMAIGYYREDMEIIPKWQAVHNSFIQILVEVGPFGFIVFVSLIIGSLKNFSYCRKTEGLPNKTHEFKMIAGLLQIGFIGSLITAFFLSQAYSMLFTLFFAFSAVMRKLNYEIGNINNTRTSQKSFES